MISKKSAEHHVIVAAETWLSGLVLSAVRSRPDAAERALIAAIQELWSIRAKEERT